MKQSETFNEYVELFKKMPLDKKKRLVNEEIKRLWGFLIKLNEDMGVKEKTLYNREILDLNKKEISDDDFVEAMFVYVHSIEESLGSFTCKIADIIYK